MIATSIPTLGGLDRYSREAEEYARQYGLSKFHNSDADAFRHAYASAEMTRQYNEIFARGAGSGYEFFSTFTHGPKFSETNMDL